MRRECDVLERCCGVIVMCVEFVKLGVRGVEVCSDDVLNVLN